MGVHKNMRITDNTLESKKKDVDKVHYLFFHRIYSIEDIEFYFKGKYSYKEIKDMIRRKINGR